MNKRFLVLIFACCLTLWQHSLFALRRDIHEACYCTKHRLKKYPNKPDNAKEFRHLIPKMNIRCGYEYCSKCKDQPQNVIFSRSNPSGMSAVVSSYCSCLKQACEDYNRKKISYDKLMHLDAVNKKSQKRCRKRVIYSDYFLYKKYNSFFKKYLSYVQENRSCQCYWPELSQIAASANDTAHDKLTELFGNTAFSSIGCSNSSYFHDNLEHIEFFAPDSDLEEVQVATSCICHCFFFSHYYYVCKELQEYSRIHHSYAEYQYICVQLNELLASISVEFYKLYKKCLELHADKTIADELFFLEALQGNIQYRSLINDSDSHLSIIPKSLKKESSYKKQLKIDKSTLLTSDLYLLKGTICNEQMLYTAAIDMLNKAIELNSSNREAYIERAFAYFELCQFDCALQNYHSAVELTPPTIPYIAKCFVLTPNISVAEENSRINHTADSIKYISGLFEGARSGMREGAAMFIPSTLSTFTGIVQGLWALGNHPCEVLPEFYQATISFFEHVRSQPIKESLLDLAPEIRKLNEQGSALSPRELGRCQGNILGKYGFEVLANQEITSAIQYTRALRRAATMQTLKTCATTGENKAVIIAEAVKHSALRNELKKSGRLKIHKDRQGKHQPDKHNYIPSKSPLRNDIDPQKLVDEYAFTGIKDARSIGEMGCPGYIEIVNFKQIIGWDMSSGKKIETSWGKIHYSKDGTHIVPTSPRNY